MHAPTRTIPITPLPAIAQEAKIQARATRGPFSRWRSALAWATQAVFYGLPWLMMNGRQAVLFDLPADRFYLFGAVLFPQDLIYLAGLLVISALLLFFATAVAGRVWCGFACPQTVYTELFMRLERVFEGDRQARLRLDRRGWDAAKLARRGGKHLAWALLALWTGFTLVGYFTPIRELLAAVPGRLGPWESFWILFYGLAAYVNAGFLREKVCLHMCPYGRFQGSLMDADTVHVAYDTHRGEPRGSQPRHSGACVDCTLCVQVCPTGIDIREGLQAACINCGLCIDACNVVMDKLQAPRGLIRLASERELAQPGAPTPGWAQRLARRRVGVYGVLLAGATATLAVAFAERPSLRLNAIRDRSVMARQVEQGAVENVYRIRVLNASERARPLRIEALGPDGLSLSSPATLLLPPAQVQTHTVTVRLPAAQALQRAGEIVPIRLAVRDDTSPRGDGAETPTTFLVPR